MSLGSNQMEVVFFRPAHLSVAAWTERWTDACCGGRLIQVQSFFIDRQQVRLRMHRRPVPPMALWAAHLGIRGRVEALMAHVRRRHAASTGVSFAAVTPCPRHDGGSTTRCNEISVAER